MVDPVQQTEFYAVIIGFIIFAGVLVGIWVFKELVRCKGGY